MAAFVFAARLIRVPIQQSGDYATLFGEAGRLPMHRVKSAGRGVRFGQFIS
jgi:hypothetical protein